MHSVMQTMREFSIFDLIFFFSYLYLHVWKIIKQRFDVAVIVA